LLPYFLILLLSVLISNLVKRYDRTIYVRVLGLFALFMVLVSFAGLRDYSVGSDTLNYRDVFVYKLNTEISIFNLFSGVEPGFGLFQTISQNITKDFTLFLFLIAAFVVGLSMWTMKKLSLSFPVSMFVFITLGYYLFFFNGARQAMSAAIYGLALIPLLSGKKYQYMILVFVAFLFHKSALAMLPLVIPFTMRTSQKQFIVTAIFTLVLTSALSLLLTISPDLVSDKLAGYHDRTAGGGKLLMIAYIFMTLYFYLNRKYIPQNSIKEYSLYLNLCLFTTFVYIFVNLGGRDVNLIRITLFSSYGFILIWPLILKNVNYYKSVVPWLFFVISHLIFFYIYISKMMTPYFINPELL
jgi:transmembrane protein EpsG